MRTTPINLDSKKIKKPTPKDTTSKRTQKAKERSKQVKKANANKKESKKRQRTDRAFLYNLAKGKLTEDQKKMSAARAGK